MTDRVGAVILAAGAGTRLGGVAKALLVGKTRRTFLADIITTARMVGTEDVIVVVGPPHGEDVAAHAHELGARVVLNPHPERGMATSVAAGFEALAQTASDIAWLWPVDHPDVAPATLRKLLGALGEHEAVRPIVLGRGGHPPLISRDVWLQLAACGDVPGGARAVLAEVDLLDLEVDDPGCVHDIDAPADLERL